MIFRCKVKQYFLTIAYFSYENVSTIKYLLRFPSVLLIFAVGINEKQIKYINYHE